MNQKLALEILLTGESALLTGPAGSGKTYVLNKFIRLARKQGKTVAVTATTGLAATHLNGSTIHSWSGIGINDYIYEGFYDNLSQGRRETIENTDVLVIDEISMLHDFRLDMVDEVARKIRKNDVPFGGLQVVLCGDFFQLPPVNRPDKPQGSFVVNARSWQELGPVVCYLSEQHRQDDEAFLEILDALRSGDVRRRHAELLLSRQNAALDLDGATELHTTNVDVDGINAKRLKALDGEEHVYRMETSGRANYVETLQRSCLASEELVLKEGAFVMCIRNNPEKRYANGSLGVVVDFEKSTDYPIVKLKNGRQVTIAPETWELRDGDKKRASLVQLPLRLAWAITVHKSQGMTLDAAKVDLRRAFVEGMGYVALSRVRRLDALSLDGINQMALRVSPEALSIDGRLQKMSAEASQRFAHLQAVADERLLQESELPPKPAAKTWSEKLAKMRETYPNAYKPWTADEDEKLMDMFLAGKDVSVKLLTEQFGRHPGSIRARLKKHFGEDAVVTTTV